MFSGRFFKGASTFFANVFFYNDWLALSSNANLLPLFFIVLQPFFASIEKKGWLLLNNNQSIFNSFCVSTVFWYSTLFTAIHLFWKILIEVLYCTRAKLVPLVVNLFFWLVEKGKQLKHFEMLSSVASGAQILFSYGGKKRYASSLLHHCFGKYCCLVQWNEFLSHLWVLT